MQLLLLDQGGINTSENKMYEEIKALLMAILISLWIFLVTFVASTVFAAGRDYSFPLIRLRPGGEFTNYNYVVNDDSYTRVINFDNVTSLREASAKDGILVVDGNMNINFESGLARREFIEAYTKYIDTKNKVNEDIEEESHLEGIIKAVSFVIIMMASLYILIVTYKKDKL